MPPGRTLDVGVGAGVFLLVGGAGDFVALGVGDSVGACEGEGVTSVTIGDGVGDSVGDGVADGVNGGVFGFVFKPV